MGFAREVDVVVIGAGAAGLAAAEHFRLTGVDAIVLEAKDRLGGRAVTDVHTFGVPWDRGAHWLHSADVNPMRYIADQLGHRYRKGTEEPQALHLDPRRLHLGDRWATEAEARHFMDWWADALVRLQRLGEAGHDVPAADIYDSTHRWYRLARHWHEIISAFAPEEISTLDLSRYRDTGVNWPVESGYGALVAAYGARIPVSLSTPVTRIDWRGRDVLVDTTKGTLRARAVILTPSTNVLARGAIEFVPDLPGRMKTALEAVPTGGANKVAFHFSRDVFGGADHGGADYLSEVNREQHALYFEIKPFGRPLAIAHLGGAFAVQMESEGATAMQHVAREALGHMFGQDIFKYCTGMAATSWCGDPHILGGYSCARPGSADARRVLAEPIDEKIYLAGEAVHPDWYSTVQGAHLTGIDAATKIVGLLSAPRIR